MRVTETIRTAYRARYRPSNSPILCRFLMAAVLVNPLTLPKVAADEETGSITSRLELPVVRIAERYPPYADFCRRLPEQCRLNGDEVIEHGRQLQQDLDEVSATLNREIRFALDREVHAVEDYWSLPTAGYGDCEDLALAKRAELVRRGYPSAALRLAFVFHQRDLSSHCVLTVETTRGTLVLDSDADAVQFWHDTAYNFEARERPDGRWDRYDQTQWRFNGAVPGGP